MARNLLLVHTICGVTLWNVRVLLSLQLRPPLPQPCPPLLLPLLRVLLQLLLPQTLPLPTRLLSWRQQIPLPFPSLGSFLCRPVRQPFLCQRPPRLAPNLLGYLGHHPFLIVSFIFCYLSTNVSVFPLVSKINPANYPALDVVPPTDSPEVQQWIAEVAATGIVIPDFSQTYNGSFSLLSYIVKQPLHFYRWLS